MKKLILPSVLLGTVITILVPYVFAEGKHEGGHGHDDAHWTSPIDAASRVNPIKNDQGSLERGKMIFMANCTSCHGVTAKGDGPLAASLSPKPTDLTIMAGNHSDGDFEWKIANGRGAMPAWKTSFSQNQRWDLVNYIQALENPNDNGKMVGMDHSKMTEEEMKVMQSIMQGTSSHSGKGDHHKAEKSDAHIKNHKKQKHSHSH